ncbi:apoptotic protease-activating factor 1-like [Dendronephthya gigantea]|uniref:apoptotic protease-activating factor 1-like n=1 Tax=Dendronephthya gigantea TaxID=151771 RepID=UPI00106CF9DA|nr:apoptotic protease-activating factor 1-like [Dendronephthya gigantea]
MREIHRQLLIGNRTKIVDDLLVEDVLIELRSKFILDQEDCELIKSEKTNRQKAGKLLDLLPAKGFGAFEAFYESLFDKYPHLASLLKSGIGNEGIPEDHDSPFVVNNNVPSEGPMTEDHKALLESNRVAIVEDLLVDDVLSQLLSQFVFDDDDVELIRFEKTAKRRADKLLDILVKRGDSAFQHFLSALKDPYPHLAELLLAENQQERSRFPSVNADAQAIVESKLLAGGVPQQPQVFTERRRERNNLRTALRSLKNRDAWVVLHGMAGCGKTVLAADALRDALLLDTIFPGGVVWAEVGRVDRQRLLMKMQNLCMRLDKDKHSPKPQNLEEARERLRSLFSEQHPRALLVLDNLWSAHDARLFDIRARVLVTTRDVSIADCIEVTRCPVRVPDKFSSEQCMDIFSKWTNKHVTALPLEADKIIAECNGHPLMISIIGALLRDHPSRWVYYFTQLRKHKLDKFKATTYQYANPSEAIAISIDNLDKEIRKMFYDFVIFDSSIKVPISVFCLLWSEKDEVEVEDILADLVKKSLVNTTQGSDPNGESAGFGIPNIQFAYMLENCDDIEARHRRLVECYEAKCKGNFASLADDGYIYWNLVHHMLEAKLEGKAIQLLTNLAWVIRKLQVTGPADIIDDYIKVHKLIQEEEKDEFKNLNDFYNFVRTNAHIFASRPMPDVVQTALNESTNNDVYKQAKEEALKRSKKGKLYLDWCNKESLNAQSFETFETTFKPHGSGTIHCCVFSSDGKTILSSSSDGTAKVWDAMSGKLHHCLGGHDDVVICCAFNNDNTKVLTVSHDRSVKIWRLSGAQNELKLTYKDHKQDIHCAAFSPVGKEVISCSSDGAIRVWDCETGVTNAVCMGHLGVVRWCCFSSDGEKIASGSDDQTVKIWEATTRVCLITTDKHNDFVSYCCFSRDNSLVYASSSSYIWIWDSTSGEKTGCIDIKGHVLAFALSPAGDKLAVALSDAVVQLWDIDTKKQLNVYSGHKNWVHSVDFSLDGTQLVSGSADETVKVWPVDTTAFAKKVRLKKVFDVFFKDDQILIAIADNQNTVRIFTGLHGKESCSSEAFDAIITCLVFLLDGNRVAIGLEFGKIVILDVESGRSLRTLSGHSGRVYSLTKNNSGSILLSCSEDKTFMTWDAESGEALLSKEQRHEEDVTLASFIDQDRRIVTASKDGTVQVWDSALGSRLFTCVHESRSWVLACVVSPDDTKIVTSSVNSVVKAWDASTGRELFTLSPDRDVLRSLAVSDDNKIFASGSDDGTVEISSLVDGHKLASCTSHKGAWVTDIVFGKNSNQLVTVGNNVQWHQRDGKLLQQFFIKGSHLRRIKCSPDFKTFITVDNVGVLYILKVIA